MKCDSYCNTILKTFAHKNSLFCTYCMFTDLKNASEGRPEKLCTLISANKMIISYITIHPSPRAMHQNADQCVQHWDQICKYHYCGNLFGQMTVYFTFYSITKYHAAEEGRYHYCGNLFAQMTVYFAFYSITKYHAAEEGRPLDLKCHLSDKKWWTKCLWQLNDEDAVLVTRTDRWTTTLKPRSSGPRKTH